MDVNDLSLKLTKNPGLQKFLSEKIQKEKMIERLIWEKDVYGIDKANYSSNIFRVTKLEYVLKSLCEDKSHYSSPYKWDDPLDSIFVRSKLRAKKTGQIISQSYQYDFFCQCWHAKGDDEYMWSRFSRRDNNGKYSSVMIQSSLKDVMESIYKETGGRIFSGKVKYFKEEELVNPDLFYKEGDGGSLLFAFGGDGLKCTLFFKCDYYRDEEEIRFCVMDKYMGGKVRKAYEEKLGKDKIPGLDYPMKTKYSGLIHKVIVDPRIKDDKEYTRISDELCKFGITPEKSTVKIVREFNIAKPQLPEEIVYNLDIEI